MERKEEEPILSIDDNYLIKGDNGTACDRLMNPFKEQVRCVYIDPPYNNGESYAHYEDALSHELWLHNMREILGKLKKFLTKNGSIWISIDDSEVHYLKVLCDEVFGRSSFITTIVWQHRTSRENRNTFSNNHEYILVYARDPASFKASRNLLPLNAATMARYKNPDNDPRGPWQSVSLNVQAGHAVRSQFYTIQSPSGKEFDPPNGRCWIYNQQRMKAEIASNNIWFGPDGDATPRKKMFLAGSKKGLTPETLWKASEVGTTNKAKKQLLALFPKEIVFDTPKPEELIKQILAIATDPGDTVMDAFLGSGTTTAVAHKMKRKYIGIELGDHIAYARERMNHVIRGEAGGISKSVGWNGGGGYRYLDWSASRRQGPPQQEAVEASVLLLKGGNG